MNWRDLDGSGCGLIEALSYHLSGGTGKNHEYYGGSLLVSQNLKLEASECKAK
jgi:hypothetical protein